MANVFQKVQLRFGDGSVRERKGEGKKAAGETEGIRGASPGLEIPDGGAGGGERGEGRGSGRGGFPASLLKRSGCRRGRGHPV